MKTTLHVRENGSPYQTRGLAAWVRACAAYLDLNHHLWVEFRPACRRWHGRASLGGTTSTYWLTPDMTPRELAWLIEHELLHNRGLHHKDYAPGLRWWHRAPEEVRPWAARLPMPKLKVARAPKPKPTVEQKRAARLAHAEAMLARAATRRRRAETIEKKWKRTVARMRREAERTAAPPLPMAATKGE